MRNNSTPSLTVYSDTWSKVVEKRIWEGKRLEDTDRQRDKEKDRETDRQTGAEAAAKVNVQLSYQ